MVETLSVSSPETSAVAQIERLVAQLDAALPKVNVGSLLATPTLTPEQFDSLTAEW